MWRGRLWMDPGWYRVCNLLTSSRLAHPHWPTMCWSCILNNVRQFCPRGLRHAWVDGATGPIGRLGRAVHLSRIQYSSTSNGSQSPTSASGARQRNTARRCFGAVRSPLAHGLTCSRTQADSPEPTHGFVSWATPSSGGTGAGLARNRLSQPGGQRVSPNRALTLHPNQWYHDDIDFGIVRSWPLSQSPFIEECAGKPLQPTAVPGAILVAVCSLPRQRQPYFQSRVCAHGTAS